jgi:hypothetical protein
MLTDLSRGGGTGRRARLKIWWWQHRVGSIPTLGIIIWLVKLPIVTMERTNCRSLVVPNTFHRGGGSRDRDHVGFHRDA